jgi:hypothetical protein
MDCSCSSRFKTHFSASNIVALWDDYVSVPIAGIVCTTTTLKQISAASVVDKYEKHKCAHRLKHYIPVVQNSTFVDESTIFEIFPPEKHFQVCCNLIFISLSCNRIWLFSLLFWVRISFHS